MADMSLLQKILAVLFPPRTTEQATMHTTEDEFLALASPTVLEGTEVVSLLPYRHETVSACIREAKFHTNERAVRLLARTLEEFLLEWSATYMKPVQLVLVPIPLSEKRSRARGYNQVERVCARAIRTLESLSCRTDVLIRTKDTAPQTTLHRKERLSNMQGAFAAKNVLEHETYIVVDDVVTTGATLADAKRALLQAGARRVLCIALSH